MAKHGFALSRLRITGANVAPAEISFSAGLNVITGPSNTGKSYVLQCIDYMLGGQTEPKEIPESAGYESLSLELKTPDGQFHTLRRGLRGGNFNLYNCATDEIGDDTPVEFLAQRKDKDKPNISNFLMKLSGMRPMRIRKDRNDTTADFSFRSVSKLFAVSETNMLSEESPLFVQSVEKSSANSAFQALITGVDDSALIAKPKKEVVEAKVQGQTLVYEDLIARTQQELERIREQYSTPPTAAQIDAGISKISATIDSLNEQIDSSATERRRIIDASTELESKISTIEQLAVRFRLLNEHYNSDLKRLDFISEGEYLVSQLQESICESCGRTLEGVKHSHAHDVNNGQNGDNTHSVQDACRAEAAKIRRHIADLSKTFTTLSEEHSELTEKRSELKASLAKTDHDFRSSLKPLLVIEQQRLRTLLDVRRDYDRIQLLHHNLNSYTVAKAALRKGDNMPKSKANPPTEITNETAETRTMALRKLCDKISLLLNRWEFAEAAVVEFDSKSLDLVISGIQRTSNGKGVRGLLHAAFNIGLLDYCKTNHKPHPGFVVLDSPLTTLKETAPTGQKDEDVSESVQQAFFADLAGRTDQIIILENKVPSDDLRSQINLIEFTHQITEGRYGLFPVRRA